MRQATAGFESCTRKYRRASSRPIGSNRRVAAWCLALGLAMTVCNATFAKETATVGFPYGVRPSSQLLQQYETDVMIPWLVKRDYRRSATVDKHVRDTGPFIELKSYGTHPAVRIFYSPEIIDWLQRDRQGEIPDGAYIVKEMFRSPAAIYEELRTHPFLAKNPALYESLLDELLSSWVVMIKDRQGGSVDGWFWGGAGVPPAGQNCQELFNAGGQRGTRDKPSDNDACKTWLDGTIDDYSHVFYSGFGLGTCIRCHAIADSESTFSDTRNISGYDDEAPLQFRVDNSWRSPRYLGSYKSGSEPYVANGADADPGTHADRCHYEQINKPAKPTEVVELFGTVVNFLREHGDPDPCTLLNILSISPFQRPYDDGSESMAESYGPHNPSELPLTALTTAQTRRVAPQINPAFADTYNYPRKQLGPAAFTLPMQWADHVYPQRDGLGPTPENHSQYITSNNCIGCHGGLGGSPYAVSMFVQTGPESGDGYDISPYNEWRWSPMGLAGRDPIFHAQLESELILLRKDGNKLNGTVAANQKAVINTCLSCHGAMGQRQLAIDNTERCGAKDGSACDFNPDYYYLTEALTEKQLENATAQNGLPSPHPRRTPSPDYDYKQKGAFYGHFQYGELAREGISCTVCHHIAAPGSTATGLTAFNHFIDQSPADWLPGIGGQPLWTNNFIYYLAQNTTGQYETGPADEIYGPYADVITEPMQASLGITPRAAPAMADKLNKTSVADSFTADSNMCGTCHTINLPNIGLEAVPGCDPRTESDCNPVLTRIEARDAFKSYTHSIEQSTYIEWVNSDFGPGMFNTRGDDFQSCQDCHMPNRLRSYDDKTLRDPGVDIDSVKPSVDVEPLVSQIATIQDTTYAYADNALPPREMSVPLRDTYRRHELVGLNAFVIEMAAQFPDILGVDLSAYETGASNGTQLAIDSILLSAREQRVVSLLLDEPTVSQDTLTTKVTVINKTGHRFPSGVAFRRAWIEFAVYGEGDTNQSPLWASGMTNTAGLITDTRGAVLTTELLDEPGGPDGLAQYQQHWQTISSDQQVQIYEELITNAESEFTTSFIHRVHHIKDNRLLPKGWVDANTFAGYNTALSDADPRKIQPQGEVLLQFFKATDPDGVDGDSDYQTGTDDAGYLTPTDGSDSLNYAIPCRDFGGCDKAKRVVATVHFQATPPSWLKQRFRLAAEAKKQNLSTPATDRLYYLMSRLKVADTPLQDYKLAVVSASRTVQ